MQIKIIANGGLLFIWMLSSVFSSLHNQPSSMGRDTYSQKPWSLVLRVLAENRSGLSSVSVNQMNGALSHSFVVLTHARTHAHTQRYTHTHKERYTVTHTQHDLKVEVGQFEQRERRAEEGRA